MNAPSYDGALAGWRKASCSNPANNCVEIARPVAPIVGIRDSKAPHAGSLVITPAAFGIFLDILNS
jgi:hypothetical protein